MINLNSNYLKWIISFFIFTFCLSCQNKSKVKQTNSTYQNLDSFCLANKICDLDTINALLILSDNGCISCNKSFISIVNKYLTKRKTVTLITASSARLDLSFLEDKILKNIYIDYSKEFEGLKILDKSGVIFITKNKIDTIVELDVNQLEKQFVFINQKLEN